jgi:lipid II isoglutaminyl synthase (glutamine-hydrolysing)
MSEQVQDTGMVLKIGHLYPTLMSVAADRGNLFSIEKRCKWRGIGTEVEQIFVKQTPDFTKYDLILFHGGADREMELASRDIQAKAPSLREAAESNTVFLSVCAISGTRTQRSRTARLLYRSWGYSFHDPHGNGVRTGAYGQEDASRL